MRYIWQKCFVPIPQMDDYFISILVSCMMCGAGKRFMSQCACSHMTTCRSQLCPSTMCVPGDQTQVIKFAW